jgi:hypothetical protein
MLRARSHEWAVEQPIWLVRSAEPAIVRSCRSPKKRLTHRTWGGPYQVRRGEGLATDNLFSVNFGQPTVFMDPRRAMIGVRVRIPPIVISPSTPS